MCLAAKTLAVAVGVATPMPEVAVPKPERAFGCLEAVVVVVWIGSPTSIESADVVAG